MGSKCKQLDKDEPHPKYFVANKMKRMLLTMIGNAKGCTNQCEHCLQHLICRRRSQNNPNKQAQMTAKHRWKAYIAVKLLKGSSIKRE